VTRAGSLSLAMLAQSDQLDDDATIGEALVGDRAEHEWAGDRAFRDVLDGLLGVIETFSISTGRRKFPLDWAKES
jgi:ATP-binding cassette subfamily F protein uup